MAKRKPKKPKTPKPKKPIAKGALWGAEIAEAAAKAKRELDEYKRKLGLQLEGEQRQRERERERERQQEAKLKTAKWSRDLSWQSKPPPPEVIFMLIGGKPVRLRLVHQHNMPVYLPDIEELP
jgi:hypothetical protein